MKDKSTYILMALLLLMIALIIFFSNSIVEKKQFVKPPFDKSALSGVPNVLDFEKKVVNIAEAYDVYVEPLPVLDDGKLLVNFTSLESNDILIKLRIKDYEGNIVGESGLIKPGNYIEAVDVSGVTFGNEINYMIMGYEFNTYISAGTVSLKTKVGEINEKIN